MKRLVRNSLLLSVAIIFVGCGTKNSMMYRKDGYSSQRDAELASKPSNSFKYNMQPYTVFGKTYEPSFVSVGQEIDGIASWYGPDFHSKKTANGENYNMYAQTAAHKTLPINTMVKVTNKNNGKSTIVRINDRGPFVDGRIIDLSFSAGKEIGIEDKGIAPVRLTVLGFDSIIAAKGAKVQQSRAISSFAVQIGAFSQKESANRFANENVTVDGVYKSVVKKYSRDSQDIYRVFLSGFKSEEEARDFVKSNRFKGSYIINLE